MRCAKLLLISMILTWGGCQKEKMSQPTHPPSLLSDANQTTVVIPAKKWIAGYSVEKCPIRAILLGEGPITILIMGVFHGDEPQGQNVIAKLANFLEENPKILENRRVILVPVVNPDGLAMGTRTNAHGVDINRNFPAKNWRKDFLEPRYNPGPYPFSEPESQVVIKLLREYRPGRIISIHSPLHNINYDGPAKNLALEMAKFNHYPVKSNIGYPTPGSFGSFCVEKNISLITLELPDITPEEGWQQNKEALVAAIHF